MSESERCCCRGKCISITLLVIGVVLAVTGVVLLYKLRDAVHSQIDKEIPLKNGTETFKAWVDPPSPIYMQFWLFDLVNAEDYIAGKAKPILREKGPYTYQELRPKKGLNFSKDDSLISYKEPKTYVFLRNMSVGSELDNVTTLNFPVLTVMTMIRFWPNWALDLLEPIMVMAREKLFKQYSVKDYLWGFKDPLLAEMNKISLKIFGKKIVANDTFGLFYGPTGNGTDDGLYTVFTGRKDVSRFNEIYQWNQNGSVPYWDNQYCNMINGSDGSSYHPFINKDERLYIFSSDVCRSLYVTYLEDVTVKGIPMYKFSPPDSVLADYKHNPDNKGYCTPDCLGSGVLNISTCRQGAPVIISQPHFYQGDEKYINAFVGIKPDPNQHSTVMNIEPNTGAVLDAGKKLQMNFYIRNLKGFKDTYNLNDTIYPVLWLNESAVISDDEAAEFRQKLLLPVRLSEILPWVLIAVGGVCILAALLVYAYCRGNKQEGSTDIQQGGSQTDDEQDKLLPDPSDNHSYSSTADA